MTKPTGAHDWPPTRVEDVVDTIQGVAVHDPYRWLEDGERDEVKAWSDAQDVYGRRVLDALPGRDALRARLRELYYYDSIGVPVRRGERFFYSRRGADKEKAQLYLRIGESGAESVLLDPESWSSDGSKGLERWDPSPDGMLVAYKVTEHNTDEGVVRIVNVASGEVLADTITGARWAEVAWNPDGKGFYYTWLPDPGVFPPDERPAHVEVRFHRVGDDAARDEIIVPATGESDVFPLVRPSRDGHWLILTNDHGWNSSDVAFRDVRKPTTEWTTLIKGVDAKFVVEPWRDSFYVLTNDGATRFRMFKVDPAKPDRASWREIVAERPDATLMSFSIVGEHLALAYLKNAVSETRIHALDGTLVRTLDLPAFGTSEGVSGEPDQDVGYFTYSSFTEARVIYQTSLKTGAVTEYARVKLPLDTSGLVTEQVWVTSKDGTKVSMFLLHKKGLAKTGDVPTLLNGYGAYGFTMTPEYISARIPWLEAGGVYAIANLRGGGEYGEEWHRAGSLTNKQNSFDDFLAAAHYLIDTGWTSPEHLGIIGGSNGGLLVGAAMTQEPGLFHAVICMVPLSDMIRYSRFGTGRVWVSEYGSIDDPAQFKALLAYSPYHNVKDGTAYPPLLVIAADKDDRVDPMHARKLVARMQAATTGGPVVMRLERDAGHAGAGMVGSAVDRSTDIYSFASAQLR